MVECEDNDEAREIVGEDQLSRIKNGDYPCYICTGPSYTMKRLRPNGKLFIICKKCAEAIQDDQ
jgi:hypothetical protein